MHSAISLAFLLLFPLALGATATRNNDDSCDIAVMPAATLLLPHFEVSPSGETTTLFTITNTTPEERIANVTLWTDYSLEVIDFHVYLTGYDVQSINLHDIIFRGLIAPENGTGTDVSPVGEFSTPNPALHLDNCDELPGQLPAVYIQRMQQAFMQGKVPAFGASPACSSAGRPHPNAVGYATVDVVRTCGWNFWVPPGEEMLWDNVLLGDYQQVERHPESGINYSEGGPVVHIRAIPEGGTYEERVASPEYAVPFHSTFYGRYRNYKFPNQRIPNLDARQPLPTLFAARWLGGDAAQYDTYYKIWRQPAVPTLMGEDYCASLNNNLAAITDFVLFDEEENAVGFSPELNASPAGLPARIFASTNRGSLRDGEHFPPPIPGSVSGWMYLNLDNPESLGTDASQAWVILNMRSGKDLSVDLDASALGNGCTPRVGKTNVVAGESGATIRPAANANP